MLDPSILVGPQATLAELGRAATVTPEARPTPEGNATQRRAEALAAAFELMSGLDGCENLYEAARRAARQLCEINTASRAVVFWRDRDGDGLVVVGDSDERLDNQPNRTQRLLVAAAEEVAMRGGVTIWPAPKTGKRHALRTVAQLARGISASRLTGVVLPGRSGGDRGVVLLIDAPEEASANFLDAVAPPLASKLAGIQRLQPTRIEKTIRDLHDLAFGSQRKCVLGAVIEIVLVMLIPTPYKVDAELELQPVQHRFIAAPVDGPLQSSHVRPGDVVNEGDLLATINPREIEYELASIRAELNRAVQEQKGLMASHDFAGSKIASLESERLRLQSDLLEYQRENLEIHSPISGVVASGDLKQSEGMPMSRGEILFEIAPLGEFLVEIAVPESDVTHVRRGMPVHFYVHALPHRAFDGTIDRIHPRAELRNHDNIFVAEVRIRDAENVLRPGMRGRAKIISNRHPLGWNLFHKAYFALLIAAGR